MGVVLGVTSSRFLLGVASSRFLLCVTSSRFLLGVASSRFLLCVTSSRFLLCVTSSYHSPRLTFKEGNPETLQNIKERRQSTFSRTFLSVMDGVNLFVTHSSLSLVIC